MDRVALSAVLPWYGQTVFAEHEMVQCPYCFESVELGLDPESTGSMVVDCDVCCRPWQLRVWRDESGMLRVEAERSD